MDRLRLYFGNDFEINIEDVEVTRLMPYKESRNFEKMVLKFAGKSTEKFKDKRISCSNWNAKNLRKIQVIYSAFDVVALYRCYPNFHKIMISQYNQPDTMQFNIKLRLAQYAVSLKKFNKKDLRNQEKVDSFWDDNSNLVLDLIKVNYDILIFAIFSLQPISGNNLMCKVCQSYANCNFRKFLEHCKKNHFNENSQKYDDMNIKKLFMQYLNFTGRISIDNLSCTLCDNESLESENELSQHCWNKHAKIVIEFLQRPKKKKGKNIENEVENDDDQENESDNDQEDDKNDNDNKSDNDNYNDKNDNDNNNENDNDNENESDGDNNNDNENDYENDDESDNSVDENEDDDDIE